MAIDTRDKRASCVLLALSLGTIGPNPDGSLDAPADRSHLAMLYRGILVAGSTLMALERSIARRIHGGLFGRVN